MSDKFLAVELWNQKYTRGLQDHSPPNQGLNPDPGQMRVPSPNHWTTGKFPRCFDLGLPNYRVVRNEFIV